MLVHCIEFWLGLVHWKLVGLTYFVFFSFSSKYFFSESFLVSQLLLLLNTKHFEYPLFKQLILSCLRKKMGRSFYFLSMCFAE